MPQVWSADLGSTDKLVLLKLVDYAADDGGAIFPAIPTVAKACALSDRAVQKAIGRFRAAGLLVEVKPADFGKRRAIEYRIDRAVLDRLNTTAGESRSPVNDVHRCTTFTLPVNDVHPTGERDSPKSLYESLIEPSEDKRGAVAPAEYAWRGKVIRLKRPDYDRWRSAYPNVRDFDAELQACDDYYSTTPPKNGNLFFAASNWLKRANAAPGPRPPKKSIADTMREARALRENFR